MRIAVVGAGITGLGAAWLLSQRHDVVLLEGEQRLGGHSNTVDVTTPDGVIPIDTGFIVYNAPSYPNLVALFAHLQVPTVETQMSFAVSLDGGRYEYSGTGANGLFAQRSNLVSPAHWRMAADILRFHRQATAIVKQRGGTQSQPLGTWLAQNGYSRAFIDRHILPMAAAIWSATPGEMLAFPIESFARFFDNHGLLQAYRQPVWRTVKGGSREYVSRLRAALSERSPPVGVLTGDPVVSVAREASGCVVTTRSGHSEHVDRVALCCHGDTALALLADASSSERGVLEAFRYSRNEAILHTDEAFMPRRRAVWSSWNYLSRNQGGPLTVTYWMNKLQPLATRTNYFVTLNPDGVLAPGAKVQSFSYEHPLYDQAALAAQRAIWSIQGAHNVWFAGSYCGYGFHEDGLQAGLAIAEGMTRDSDAPVRRPWVVVNESGRLDFPLRTAPAATPRPITAGLT